MAMAAKGQDELSYQALATTPRRLRSGTHYGNYRNQAPAPNKKNFKKSSTESIHISNSCSNCDRDEVRSSKDHSTNHTEKTPSRLASQNSLELTCSISKQLHKGQTLKAILESIEPNISLKGKQSKRKTLKDLLDRKLFKEQKSLEEPVMANDGEKCSIKSEKRTNNGYNNHYSKIHRDKVHVESTPESKATQIQSQDQNTAHTQTTTETNSLGKVKEELPDDYWAMKLNYADKIQNKNPSMELRIKASSPTRRLNDHSQTFRISCTRPEATNKSPTAVHRNMKPDIVLKVRPRSSSLSSLSRSSSDIKRSTATFTTTSKFQGNLGSHSAIFSKVSFKSESNLASDYEKSFDGVSGFKHSYHCTVSDLTSQEILQVSPSVAKRETSVAKSLVLDQDVVEESNLPPVANTVELLSEPHDYHYNSRKPGFHLTHNSEPPRSQQATVQCREHDQCSPDLPVLESMTLIKAEPCKDEREACQRKPANFCWKADDGHSWKKCGKNPHKTDKFLTGIFPSPAAATFQMINRREAEAGVWGRQGNCLEKTALRQTADYGSKNSLEERERKSIDMTKVSSILLGETGSRRRRKGRPSRRAKTERRWQNCDLELSPREEEEEGDEEDDEKSKDHAENCQLEYEEIAVFGATANTTINTRKGTGKRQVEVANAGRRPRKSLDLETLWANPELDSHAYLLWASENRREVQKQNPEVSTWELEGLLTSQWRQLPFCSKLHFLCRARDAGIDHNKHTMRKKKGSMPKKDPQQSDGRSVYEEFLRLPQERQKDLLRKWLRFFQKMLPRLEYQDFISDFKKACKGLQLRPVPARRKNARLRNLDPSHYNMLFEKIRETRPRVISVYNKRKAREEQLLRQSFSAMIKRLIAGQPWPFVRGCRSKILGELLKDIQQLEVEEVLAQIDLPLSLVSGDLPDPFSSKDLQDSASPSQSDSTVDLTLGDAALCPITPGGHSGGKEGHSRKGSGCNAVAVVTSTLALPVGPAGDVDLPDSPFVLNLLDGLRHASDLPLLDQRCLDSVFLGPPTRSRNQTPRDNQFQNSATYRRTLLYKHIQPLLDARGVPLPSSALYHSHSAQCFYPEDR